MVTKKLTVILFGLCCFIGLVGCHENLDYPIGRDTAEYFNKGRIQIVTTSHYFVCDAKTNEQIVIGIDRFAYDEPNLIVRAPEENMYYIIDTTTGEYTTQNEIDESQYKFHKLKLTSSMIEFRKMIENTP